MGILTVNVADKSACAEGELIRGLQIQTGNIAILIGGIGAPCGACSVGHEAADCGKLCIGTQCKAVHITVIVVAGYAGTADKAAQITACALCVHDEVFNRTVNEIRLLAAGCDEAAAATAVITVECTVCIDGEVLDMTVGDAVCKTEGLMHHTAENKVCLGIYGNIGNGDTGDRCALSVV